MGKRKVKDAGKTIYIGNMSYKRNEKGIEWLFSPFGKVKSIDLITKPGTDESKGYAFVKMMRSDDAIKAIENLNGRVVDGRTLKVSEALGRQESTSAKPAKTPISLEEQDLPRSKKKASKTQKGLNALFDYLKNR